jgi:hypothetical protein
MDAAMMDKHDRRVIDLAHAIGKAEGWGAPDHLPTRINNPIDLEIGDKGWGVVKGKTVFPDPATGWEYAYREAWVVLTGQSHYVKISMTFAQFAQVYTGGDNPGEWAHIVTEELSMADPDKDTLQDYLNINTEAPNVPSDASNG